MSWKPLVAFAAAIVAISGVAAPASATLAAHHHGGTKPTPYPASVVTQLRIDMEPSTVTAGRCAWAGITVRSAGHGKPTGTVQVQVNGNSYSAAVSNGRTSLCLSGLSAGFYTVVANFSPTSGSIWKSSSDTDFLRVVKHTPGNCHQDQRPSRL